MRSGNGDSAATKRCSGASSRWRRRAAGSLRSSRRHHAEDFQIPRQGTAAGRDHRRAASILPTQAIDNFSFKHACALKPGVTPAEAQRRPRAHVADLARRVAAMPGLHARSARELANHPVVRPLKDDLVGGVASTLWVLMGAIGAVLLIACANIANLMLVRADARRQELAVRAALGAGRARIARELLVESLVLGAAGGVLGLVLAYLGVRGSRCDRPERPAAPRGDRRLSARARVHRGRLARVDARVRLDHGTQARTAHRYALGGLPRGVEREPRAERDAQRFGRRAGGARARVGRERGADDPNVSGATRRRPGFSDPATIQTARIWIPDATFRSDPEQRAPRMQREILDRIAALPGVASAGFTSMLPMDRHAANSASVVVEGETLAAGDTPPQRRWKFVSPGYFEAMGTRIIAGRDMTWSDIETGGRVVLISEDFARELAAEPAARSANVSGRRLSRLLARGDRRRAERPPGRVVRGTTEHRCTGPCSWRTSATASSECRPSRSSFAASARAPPAS